MPRTWLTVQGMSELQFPTQALKQMPELSWAEFGLLAYIEMHRDVNVANLEQAATNGKEGLRSLLGKLRKRGLTQLKRHVNEKKRFTHASYSLA